jgi:type VI secretion system protein ImpI
MKTIQLTISNMDTLPNGGPLTYRSSGRAFEIGRDDHRDWSLPDPRLFISGRHCEVQFDGRDYVLSDLSRNGTYLNGSQQRVKSPHRLQGGDKLAIGNYVIEVQISDEPEAEGGNRDPWTGPAAAGDDDDIWGAASAGPKPMDRREFRPRPKQPPTGPDFVRSHLHMPAASPLELPPFDGGAAEQAYSSPAFGGGEQNEPPLRSPEPRPALQPGRERPAAAPGSGGDMLSQFKLGARLPHHTLSNRVPSEVAQEIGAMMLLMVEQMSLLLKARASAKALVRSQDRTIIGALDNNPMKFMADPGEALEAMLSKDRTGYLDGMRALREAFEDIKSHEMATYAAMQKALSRLLDDLSPEAIESKVSKSTFSNNKAKAWETFVQRWEAKVEAHENGMLDVFLLYFADAYKEATGKRRR